MDGRNVGMLACLSRGAGWGDGYTGIHEYIREKKEMTDDDTMTDDECPAPGYAPSPFGPFGPQDVRRTGRAICPRP
eukprot:1802264-Pyramimonas_sp.AAC.1